MRETVTNPALLTVRLENGRTVEEELRQLGRFSRLLDSQFSVMGVRFGADSLLGLVPVVGDVVTGISGTYAIFTAIRLRLHPLAIVHIGWNLLFDTAVGAIPLVGDVFDFFFKSNTRNFRIIERHLTRRARRQVQRAGRKRPEVR